MNEDEKYKEMLYDLIERIGKGKYKKLYYLILSKTKLLQQAGR